MIAVVKPVTGCLFVCLVDSRFVGPVYTVNKCNKSVVTANRYAAKTFVIPSLAMKTIKNKPQTSRSFYLYWRSEQMISSCWVVAQSNPTISPLSLDLLALLGNGHQLFGWNEEYKTVVKTWEKTFGLMMACEVFIWVGGLATRSRARRMLYEVTRPKTQVRNEKKKKRKPIMIDQSLLLAAKKAHPSMPWIRCVCVCV